MADDFPLLVAAEAPADDNVIEFRKRERSDDERLEQLARVVSRSPCAHRKKRLIDEKQRTIQCGECGAWLDPIWCLLNLVEYHEALKREREQIVWERQQLEKRRQGAIARRVAITKQKALVVAAAHCAACEGTGWKPGVGGVVRCDCRKGLGARLL